MRTRLSEEQRAEIRLRSEMGERQTDIAKRYGVTQGAISKLLAEGDEPPPDPRPGCVAMGGLLPHEASALRRALAEMAAGPEFAKRWSALDLQTCLLALRRITGVDALGAT